MYQPYTMPPLHQTTFTTRTLKKHETSTLTLALTPTLTPTSTLCITRALKKHEATMSEATTPYHPYTIHPSP